MTVIENAQTDAKEEVAQRGEELYASVIASQLKAEDRGKYLIIDVDTGDYELDRSHLAASRRLRDRRPEGRRYGMRVGYSTLGKIGGSWKQP